MVYLNNIVEFLNITIKGRLLKYPTAGYNGVATYATKDQKQGEIKYPTLITYGKNGAETLAFDSNTPFTIYHRLSGTTFSKGPSYGDDAYSTISATDLQIVVWGTRKKIDTSPEQFAMILTDTLPDIITADELSGMGINNINITPLSINYDQRSVFAQEMQGVKYFTGPELFLFSIRYRIEGSYTKGCLNNCDC